jgi:hypothetical protein
MLFEYLVDEEQTPAEWFLVEPRDNYAGFEVLCWDLQRPVEAMRPNLSVWADRMKPGVHVGGGLDPVYVSERFREVVQANRLRGINFVWCKDIGKYRAPQWYYPVCDRCLGRGLGEFEVRPRDPGLQELLALVRKMELLRRPADCYTFKRYLRKYLPETDFAFTVRDVTSDGRSFRHRGLAMNRRARDILRANRVIGDEHCAPVMILGRAPAGVDNLDRRLGPAEPTFSPEQMKQIRRLEAAALAEHAARPKPPRAPDLDRSLKLLRAQTPDTRSIRTPGRGSRHRQVGPRRGRLDPGRLAKSAAHQQRRSHRRQPARLRLRVSHHPCGKAGQGPAYRDQLFPENRRGVAGHVVARNRNGNRRFDLARYESAAIERQRRALD